MIRHLKPADYRRERWKNGLGWTNEIAHGRIEPQAGITARDGITVEWDWRLSIADIDRDSPFSAFPGIDRTLILLSGADMRLRFDGGTAMTLQAPGDRVDFAGEWSLCCELSTGPTRDFNIMCRRDRMQAQVAVQQLNGTHRIAPADGPVACHVIEGELETVTMDHRNQLRGGDTFIDDGDPWHGTVLSGSAFVIVVRFESRSPA